MTECEISIDLVSKKVLGNRSRARAYVISKRAKLALLKDKPCHDCGVKYPYYVMDYDHRPDEVKLFTIGHSTLFSWPKILAEIAKCDLVCANCHRERTHQRRRMNDTGIK